MSKEPVLLDVGPLLAEGGQPMAAILSAVDGLAPGQALRLRAPFRPQPLFAVLAKRGYRADAVDAPDGSCAVLFTPLLETLPEAPADETPSPLAWPAPSRHLDLSDRDLSSPSARILSELDGMTEGSVLFVLLPGEPEALYSDLTRRGHRWVGNFDASGETYRMLIRRGA